MLHDPRKSLSDIEQAAERIMRFSFGKTQNDYLSDDYFRSAVERQFEIVGEAVNRLRKASPLLAERLSEFQKIIGFRNQLAHGYDIIEDEISWIAIELKLPVLLIEVKKLISELDIEKAKTTVSKNDFPWIIISPSARRQTLSVGERMMQVQVVIAPHTTMPTHSHPHEQHVYVARGSVTFNVGDQTHELSAGESIYLPGDLPHGCVTGDAETVLIDTFTPLRDDLIAQDEAAGHKH